MDKQQEASAPPPNFEDPPPAYPGNEPAAQQYGGGFAQPPPGTNIQSIDNIGRNTEKYQHMNQQLIHTMNRRVRSQYHVLQEFRGQFDFNSGQSLTGAGAGVNDEIALRPVNSLERATSAFDSMRAFHEIT